MVSLSRARHLSGYLFDVSASGAIIAAATANLRRVSQQNPYKARVSLVELGRISGHLIQHFGKIPTKMFLRYRCCAVNDETLGDFQRLQAAELTVDTVFRRCDDVLSSC